jgi:hypothetical protein
MKSQNDAVYRAVNNAVYWNVHGAVNRAVYWAVNEAGNRAVVRATNGDVSGAVWGDVGQDPDHPALQDFLGEAR